VAAGQDNEEMEDDGELDDNSDIFTSFELGA
jgi:hypothetical protein